MFASERRSSASASSRSEKAELRIALVSPLPPAPSGVAEYAERIAAGLRGWAQVDTFEAAAPERLAEYDVRLYQIGNNALHAGAYYAALTTPAKPTMPSRHTGEGIFFSSKAADRFEITSGALRWIVDNRKNDMAVGALDPSVPGTTVQAEIDVQNPKDLTAVFAEYTQDFEFSRTRTVVRLFSIDTEFLSRSQAKRIVHGLEKFREVVLDFEGVDLVGQGFADEVFRVWAERHPEVLLIPAGMNGPVAFMVERAIREGQESV